MQLDTSSAEQIASRATLIRSRPTNEATIHCLRYEYYNHFIVGGSRAKKNPVRSLEPYEHKPGMISLLAGKPNADVFPISSIQFTARVPSVTTNTETFIVTGEKLKQALQYGPTHGIPSMIEWLLGFQEIWHGRKAGEGWKLTIGAGSQDLLYKASLAILEPGDYVLIESPAYAGYLPVLHTLKANIIPIKTDSKGLMPSSLQQVMENWPSQRPRPKMLYTVPVGSNPSGVTTLVERRRKILSLAQKFDFLVFEDDPYFHLYYGDLPRPASYFALELELREVGRVVRFDSLSKTISGGLRLGFACGPVPIIDIINANTAISNLQVSTFSQVIASTLFHRWGHDEFRKHVEYVAAFYKNRRDKFAAALSRYLKGLAEWTLPDAGMFIWIKLLLESPSSPGPVPSRILGENDVVHRENVHSNSSRILQLSIERGVLPLPGSAFMPDETDTPYLRVSMSQVNEKDIEEAIKRLAGAIMVLRREIGLEVPRARL